MQNICLLIIAGTCLGATLSFLKGVLVPFALALFLNILLSPLVNLQVTRLRLPRWLAVVTTLALSTLMLAFLASMVTTSVGQLAGNMKAYEARFQELVLAGFNRIPTELAEHLNTGWLLNLSSEAISSGLKNVSDAILFILSQSILVFLFLIFLLLGEIKATPGGLFKEIEARRKRYLLTKTGVSCITALLFGLVLTTAQVELALVFALLTFILNFVPNVGFIAVVLPVPVLLFSPSLSIGGAILVILILLVVQFTMGNLVEPKIVGETLSLHPITVLLSLLLWGTLWGSVGMVLAVPLTATIHIILEQIEGGTPIARAMAGRLSLEEAEDEQVED